VECSFHASTGRRENAAWVRRAAQALHRFGAGPDFYASTEGKMDRISFDELVKRLLESLPAGVRTLQRDLDTNFRAALRANLARLDLVTRDEFDAQARVLERTRAKLEALEAQVAALEGRANGAGD